jgi:hypothetical protein
MMNYVEVKPRSPEAQKPRSPEAQKPRSPEDYLDGLKGDRVMVRDFKTRGL